MAMQPTDGVRSDNQGPKHLSLSNSGTCVLNRLPQTHSWVGGQSSPAPHPALPGSSSWKQKTLKKNKDN